MIESVMYFGIGFLVAALLGLLFIPMVHNRAVRLTMKRLEASMPLSIAEIRADNDQVRSEFAVSTRRLEMKIEKLKVQTTTQLAEHGKKTDAINWLKKELAENKVTNLALEARIKPLRDQLRATEEELQTKSNARSSKPTVNSPITKLSWRRCGPKSASDRSPPANLDFRRLLRVSCRACLAHWAFLRQGFQIHLLGR